MCEYFDELNQTCMWERMERIVQTGYRDEQAAWTEIVEDCLEDF